MSDNYLIQPKLHNERNADYEKSKYIKNTFTLVDPTIIECMTCGNINYHFVFDKDGSKFKIIDEWKFPLPPNQKSMSSTISSALALYRLMAIFGPMKIMSDSYKSVWDFALKHQSSGKIITLYDYKGAFSFGSEFSNIKEVPEELKNDLVELLNLICSDQSPHPYDGTVAGSIA